MKKLFNKKNKLDFLNSNKMVENEQKYFTEHQNKWLWDHLFLWFSLIDQIIKYEVYFIIQWFKLNNDNHIMPMILIVKKLIKKIMIVFHIQIFCNI